MVQTRYQETSMSHHLPAGQRALLEAELQQRQKDLDRIIAERQEGLSRAEHARAMLQQDSDDITLREPERQLDMTLSDRALVELGQVSDALRRLHGEDYGQCVDCGEGIPFDRLKAEPWALRCVPCESAREREAARR
jgi:DnaK suppressor protein